MIIGSLVRLLRLYACCCALCGHACIDAPGGATEEDLYCTADMGLQQVRQL